MKKYGDLMACYMYIEDEQQDWKLNNLKSHPPRDCGERGMGFFMNKQPQRDWSGTG